MRADSRLSRVLHVLLHMSASSDPMTSEQIAQIIKTNSAVIRRTMAGLRKAGYVSSEKGHHGGWTLSCDLKNVTLLDIFEAVGTKQIFAIGLDQQDPNCAVEKAVNEAIRGAMHEAESILLSCFGNLTLEELSLRFKKYL